MDAIAATLCRMEPKSQIRKRMIAKRRALSPADAAARSNRVHDRLRTLPEFHNAGRMLTYVSAKDNEVDTRSIIERLLAEGRCVACPRTVPERLLEWRRISSVDDLTGARFGIPEPDPDRCETILPGRFDVVLVPGIVFTRAGHRIGYGGGYFDRFLSTFAGTSIGLAYDFQVLGSIPIEAHDVRVTLVVTETGVHPR